MARGDARGLKMNRFVEDAIVDKLEDVKDLKAIRHITVLKVAHRGDV